MFNHITVWNTLIKYDFVTKSEKSIWELYKTLTWLVIDINNSAGVLKVTPSCIQNISNYFSFILQKIFVAARNLAKLVGQPISTKYVIGDIVQLQTTFLETRSLTLVIRQIRSMKFYLGIPI